MANGGWYNYRNGMALCIDTFTTSDLFYRAE